MRSSHFMLLQLPRRTSQKRQYPHVPFSQRIGKVSTNRELDPNYMLISVARVTGNISSSNKFGRDGYIVGIRLFRGGFTGWSGYNKVVGNSTSFLVGTRLGRKQTQTHPSGFGAMHARKVEQQLVIAGVGDWIDHC